MVEDLETKEPEEIEREIERTRESLTYKLEALENGVKEVVQDAKESVGNTVEDVKQAFSLRHQIGEHPWIALGISFAAGFALAQPIKQLVSDEVRTARRRGHSNPSPLLKAAGNLAASLLWQALSRSSLRNDPSPSPEVAPERNSVRETHYDA